MPITLFFSQNVNTSLQVGDMVYQLPVNPASVGGFSTTSINTPALLGECLDIGNPPVSISVDASAFAAGNFVMFAKNPSVNTSGVKGYYAKLKFKNTASRFKKIELFGVSAEITESSK